MLRPPVVPFSSGIWCPAARAPSWRGLNGLYTSPHECYDDDENDENAKRDQFSCNHTALPDADCAATTPRGVASLNDGVPNQVSGGARDASGSLRSAFRNAFGGSSEMERGEALATPNQRRSTERASGTKLPPPTFIRVTRTAATALVAGDDSSTELRPPASEPRQSLGPALIPTIQTAVATAIESSGTQKRFGTLSQVTSRMPALPANLALVRDAAVRLSR
jgi:hypothetical protein